MVPLGCLEFNTEVFHLTSTIKRETFENGYNEMYCASYFQGKSHTFVFGSQILGGETVSHVHFFYLLTFHIQILLVNLV